MKGFVYSAAAVALLAVSSVHGMKTFLKQFPNGDKFAKALGHVGDSDTDFTAFGTAFMNAGEVWSASFCKTTFPGSKITVGQAFGDPCCTWTVNSAAPQSVSAFTTDPGAGTTCATDSTATTAPPASSSTPASGSDSSSSAAASTPAPSSGSSGSSSTTPSAPASSSSPSSSKKAKKSDKKSHKKSDKKSDKKKNCKKSRF